MAGRHISRLYCADALGAGQAVALGADAARHLASVLRLAVGDEVRLFDDVTGEWTAHIDAVSKRDVIVRVERQVSQRETVPDVWLCAAPIKRARYEWIAEKACELGAARLVPLLTARTGGVEAQQAKPERLKAHMIEAAAQCGRTALPELGDAVRLTQFLRDWPAERALIFCDEESAGKNGADAIETLKACPAPAAILIGPEGGFSDDERAAISAVAQARRISLGPRILRADTAAVAALALWQAAHEQR
ncbi:16S rRNA (uracil(1498)-N(3))-methyltransferase [Pacificimonas sp. WHA3]|uniref:Ribosomal RNA small subunit methyltransferase E n=1 Tax=Pacificimonas pallii TaxID=2827236 RepID=A0ABS6SGW0_9SPHN|nr:16S rRNA (uracil(1498)-N(3))-methyltransferase [Pacificimonas pallii]MBV7257639.1 16S rRNA (uracil(1498)-N(3))-methyltransferase [Pacificimonas pallii]